MAAPKGASFFISGRGWGHGIGMSQWGAYGYAQRGTTYDQILSHYYTGTVLGNAPVSRVRVLLGEGKKAIAVSSDSPFSVKDGSGAVHQLQPGPYSFGQGLKVKVDAAQPPQALPGPLVFVPGATPLTYGGKEYRGQLQVNVVGKTLQLVNSVGLQQYLYGVVPREVPSAWPVEALKAQAVVARSYALAVRKSGAAFDLFADTRSQVYGGIAAEKPTTTAAVDATSGQVLLFEGKVATTYFFSTSGGRTASIEDAWARGEPTPYLVSVPDPYDTASPHHVWGPFGFTAAKLTSTFKVPGTLLDVKIAINPSQRVREMTLVGTKGEVVVPGEVVRTKLGLRSTWFRVGVLSIEQQRALEYGAKTKLKGVVRGNAKVMLEQRVSGQIWEPAARVAPAADGSFAITVKPLVSTQYRLAVSPTLFSTTVKLAVAPRVRLQPVTSPALLRGLVRPVLPGARVDVQRLEGTTWRPAATAALDAAGAFEAQLELTPGTYRARVAPGRGFVAGVSPVLQVVAG